MEELTIEQKAEAYDKAIERAKKWRNAPNIDKIPTFGNRVIEEIFPELKESEENEDNRMRKHIIEILKDNFSGEDTDKCIAWLEKQSMSQVRTGLEWVNTIDDACDRRYSEEYAHGEYCHEQSFKWGFQEGVDWLEKQGESKLPEDLGEYIVELSKQFPEVSFAKLSRIAVRVKNWLEKQGEQKSNDKVEFEIGDLITNGILVGEIDEIHELGYHAYFGDHYADVPDIENWHKWTIQDAKDGDVLATSKGAFIYNGNNGGGSCPGCYCGINTLGNFKTGVEHHWTGRKVYPATKEQRDTLFAKMKEAGYEWDAEKKELKKIETKFKVGDWVITNKNHIWYVDETPETTSYLYRLINQYGKVEVAEFEVVDKKARLWTIQNAKDGDVLVSSSGKPFIFKGFFDNDPMAYGGLVADDSFWPASNSNWTTVYCKPATKEQRNALMKAMADAGYIFDFGKKELKKIDDVRTTGYWHVEDIEQNPVWSEEDENRINRLIAYFEDKESFTAEDDVVYANWLKSLKDRVQPQSTWKPSEEQLRELENVFSPNTDSWDEDILRELYKQLKQL